MELRDYLAQRRTHETTKAFCERNGLNPVSVILVANGHRKAGPKLARKISLATGGIVPLSAIRAEIWG